MKRETIKFDTKAKDVPTALGLDIDREELEELIDEIKDHIARSVIFRESEEGMEVGLDKANSLPKVLEEIGEVNLEEAFYWGLVFGSSNERISRQLDKAIQAITKEGGNPEQLVLNAILKKREKTNDQT